MSTEIEELKTAQSESVESGTEASWRFVGDDASLLPPLHLTFDSQWLSDSDPKGESSNSSKTKKSPDAET